MRTPLTRCVALVRSLSSRWTVNVKACCQEGCSKRPLAPATPPEAMVENLKFKTADLKLSAEHNTWAFGAGGKRGGSMLTSPRTVARALAAHYERLLRKERDRSLGADAEFRVPPRSTAPWRIGLSRAPPPAAARGCSSLRSMCHPSLLVPHSQVSFPSIHASHGLYVSHLRVHYTLAPNPPHASVGFGPMLGKP